MYFLTAISSLTQWFVKSFIQQLIVEAWSRGLNLFHFLDDERSLNDYSRILCDQVRLCSSHFPYLVEKKSFQMHSLLFQRLTHDDYLISSNPHISFVLLLGIMSLLYLMTKFFVCFESDSLSWNFKSLSCFTDHLIHQRCLLFCHILLFMSYTWESSRSHVWFVLLWSET